MCFSDSVDHFDIPLDYTQTILMEIQHFHACITTMRTSCKPQVQSGTPTTTIEPGGGCTFLEFFWSGSH